MSFHFANHDDDDKLIAVTSVDKADLDALAKHCADMRAAGEGNGKDDKLAMRADTFTITAWCERKGVTWKQFFRTPELIDRFIMDPDNAAFRVWQGRL
jgi:hypothetical protein